MVMKMVKQQTFSRVDKEYFKAIYIVCIDEFISV